MSDTKTYKVRLFSAVLRDVINLCEEFYDEATDGEVTSPFDGDRLADVLVDSLSVELFRQDSAILSKAFPVVFLANKFEVAGLAKDVITDWSENNGIDSSYLLDELFASGGPLDFTGVNYVELDVEF